VGNRYLVNAWYDEFNVKKALCIRHSLFLYLGITGARHGFEDTEERIILKLIVIQDQFCTLDGHPFHIHDLADEVPAFIQVNIYVPDDIVSNHGHIVGVTIRIFICSDHESIIAWIQVADGKRSVFGFELPYDSSRA